jgi:hypothetical protein
MSDDGQAGVTVSITDFNLTKREGSSSTLTLTVTRTGDTSSYTFVGYEIVGRGPKPASAADFAGGYVPGVITFLPGDPTPQTVEVEVLADDVVELDEDFTVRLYNLSEDPSDAVTIGTGSAPGTILNDDTSADFRLYDPSQETPAALLSHALGDVTGISIDWQSVRYSGGTEAAAYFDELDFGAGVSLPRRGILLSSGTAAPPRANTDPGYSVPLDTPGDAGLEAVAKAAYPSAGETSDASVLTFTYAVTAPTARSVAFDLVFGSEEYPDFVDSEFVDVAAILVNGINVALIDGDRSKPLSITGLTVSDGRFVDNQGGTLPIEYNGITQRLTVFVPHDGSPSYTVRIGVADTGDQILDSGLFVSNIRTTAYTGSAVAVVVEGQGNLLPAGPNTATYFLATQGGTTFNGSTSPDLYDLSIPGANRVKGTPAQLHRDVAVGFGADDGILIEGLSLGPQNLSVTYGSAILNFDTDLDGGTDFTLRLEGDFSTGTFKVSPHAAGTLVTYAPPLGIAARTDAYVTLGGQAVILPATTGVLANDLTRTTPVASLVTGAERGTLALEADGRLTYGPSQGFSGIDRFSYRLTDGDATALAEALVYVIPVRTGEITTLDLLALTPEQQIAATYAAFFGRGADAGGFSFWVDQFVKNLPSLGPSRLFADIASSFGVGDEAKALYPFLANPAGASNAQIEAFLSKVYDNLFDRTPDAEGLAYWRGEIQDALKAGQFVGSVLVNVMSGAQNTAAGQDITALMSKVAVSLEYVRQQQLYGTEWTWLDDQAEAMALLDPVADAPETVLIGMASAQALVMADWVG